MHKWLFQDLGSVSPKAKAGGNPPGRSITVFDYFSTAFTAIVTFIPPGSLLWLLYANLAAAFLNSSTLSVCSQVRSKSVRPKWP